MLGQKDSNYHGEKVDPPNNKGACAGAHFSLSIKG
jgi:hypothetical protein